MTAPDIFALGGRQDDDAEILALFHDWIAACRVCDEVLASIRDDAKEDPPEWYAACDRTYDLERQIFACRGGATGMAIKAYLFCDRSNWTPQTGHLRLEGDESVDEVWTASIVRDAAALVPELGELAAAVIHEDALLIDAEMTVQWVASLGPDAERAELLRTTLARIASTPARTPRGEAIKARHAGRQL
jgi:hypothetical protein